MRVAITGSTGLVGTTLRASLPAAGHEVRPITRGPQERGGLWNPARGWIAPDAFAGVDAIVHLAGASIGEGRWTAARRAELRASRIDATHLLVDHLTTLEPRPRVLVCASAIGYYGDGGDTPLTEVAPSGSGFLAELVRDWEAEARRVEAIGVRVVSARFGIVLARDGGALPRLVLPMRFGAGGPLGNGRQWMSWIALDDVTGAIARLLEDERATGPVNLVAPEPVTNREFARTLGRVMHRPALLPAPAFALRLALGRDEANELLLASQRVVPQRLADLGYAFRHPALEGALAHILRG